MTPDDLAPDEPAVPHVNDSAVDETDAIGSALGRVPSGLFIVTTIDERGAPIGFLGSFVQQMAFDPPTIAVAVGKGRGHLEAIRRSGRLAISILGEDDKGLMKPFFKKPEDGSPFDDVKFHAPTEGGTPVLSEALAWLDCRLAGEHDAGDHVVVFGAVTGGMKMRDGEPLTHTRKDGLKYA